MQIATILLFVAISYKIPKLYEYFLSTRRKKNQTEHFSNIDMNILSSRELTSSNYAASYCFSIHYWWTFLNEKFRNLFDEDENSIQNENFEKNEYRDNDFDNFNNFNNFNNDYNEKKECQRETKYSYISKLNNKDNENNEIIKDSCISKLNNKNNKIIKDPYISNLDKKKTKITKDSYILKLDNRLTNEINEIKKINHNYSNHPFYSHNGTKRSNSSEHMDLNISHRTNLLFINPYERHENDLKLRTLLKKKHDSEVEVVKNLKKALIIQGNREVLVKNAIREVAVLRNRIDRDFRQ
ncbi:8404_t:CDS:1 [Diversispora eburnea]|uniref:8404_t:CDS:1 n=1 Tax=Diversispora eburnea TaxID=1213867 RepID=A0A9N8VW03_9GLOM|nr:8404_t:CDS:1 [Diversispora eburnea]